MSRRNRIYFRADASAVIGYGHFFRTIALASMLRDEFECHLFLHDPTPLQLKEAEKVCAVTALKDRFDDFLTYLDGTETVVLDNYFFTPQYQLSISQKGCTLVCIDDIYDRLFYADVIINHGFASKTQYSTASDTIFCLGAKWALLRPEFLQPVPDTAKRDGITICFGGGDPLGLTDRFYNIVREELPQTTVRAIKGASLNASQMAEIFRSSEICILSASSVCYEALSCGARVAAGWYVDNQKDFYEGLVSHGLVTPLGYIAERIPDRISLINALKRTSTPADRSFMPVKETPELFRTLFRTLTAGGVTAEDFRKDYTIDGLRFVNYIHLDESRKMEILEYRNHPEVRRWMCSTDVIPLRNHLDYIESLKTRDDAFYWAVFNEDGMCGGISLTALKDNTADEGIFLNPAMTGRGLGTRITRASFKLYFSLLGLNRIYSLVHKDNAAALNMDRKTGYSTGPAENGFVTIELTRRDWIENIPCGK